MRLPIEPARLAHFLHQCRDYNSRALTIKLIVYFFRITTFSHSYAGKWVNPVQPGYNLCIERVTRQQTTVFKSYCPIHSIFSAYQVHFKCYFRKPLLPATTKYNVNE